jgi:hypothetical protein
MCRLLEGTILLQSLWKKEYNLDDLVENDEILARLVSCEK